MTSLARASVSVAAYVAFIVLVNWLFIPDNLVEGVTQWSTNTWMGTLYLANVIVGFVFVLRDYAQREIGHKVLLATLLAGIPVYLLAGPGLAIASLTAFASERAGAETGAPAGFFVAVRNAGYNPGSRLP